MSLTVNLLNSMRGYLHEYKGELDTENEIIKAFYLYQQRLITPQPRKIKKSKEFNISLNTLKRYEKDNIRKIIKKIENTEDLSPYLSKRIYTKELDHLLLDWGIYHLHLEPSKTTRLIFCIFSEDTAYLIDIKPHKNSFSDKNLLEIVDNNWNIFKYTSSLLNTQTPSLSNKDIYNLRTNGYNTSHTINGKVIMGHGLGMMTCNSSLMTFHNTIYLKRCLSHAQYIIHPECIWLLQDLDNPNNIRSSFVVHPSITSFK